MNAVAKAGNLSPYFKATSTLIASGLKPQAPAIPVTKSVVAPPLRAQPLSPQFMQACLPAARLRIKSGPAVTTQVRYAHTDIQIPDFDAYRRKDTQDPSVKSSLAYEDRKATTYLVAAGGFIATAYSAKYVITGLVSSLGASADVLALASIEVNIGEIPEGKSVVFKWRGKPIFVRHRTAQEISTEESVALSELRDPQHDKDRATKPNWLVVIGVCTHLGCVPIADAGDFGGYYCPCHGSHYDASGRIRKGPAPLNLEVPPHSFQEGDILLIG